MGTNTEIRTVFVKANDMEFEVFTCGTGDKFALCLHGFPEHAFCWRYQLPFLARLGYTAWAPNLRGYGRSSRPKKVDDYKLEHLVNDVAGLIDAAGAGSTLLIAHDWGGLIAWMFTLEQKRPLERFIVMNLPHPVLFRKGIRKWPQIMKSWYITFFRIPRLPELLLGMRGAKAIGNAFYSTAVDKSRFSDDVLEAYKSNARQPGALTAMINYYRANYRLFLGRLTPKQQQVLDKYLETPTLMIWGEKDVALSKQLTFGTESLVKDFTIKYLPEVSHWVQDEAPETVNTIMETWLSDKKEAVGGMRE